MKRIHMPTDQELAKELDALAAILSVERPLSPELVGRLTAIIAKEAPRPTDRLGWRPPFILGAVVFAVLGVAYQSHSSGYFPLASAALVAMYVWGAVGVLEGAPRRRL